MKCSILTAEAGLEEKSWKLLLKKLFTLNSFTVKLVTSSPESEAVDVGNFKQQMLKHQKENHESTQ